MVAAGEVLDSCGGGVACLVLYIFRLCRVETAGHKVLVDSQAGPGVDGGIYHLPGTELGCFPVAQALTLGDTVVEDYAVDFLKARIGDVEGFHDVLQVDEIGRFESGYAVQHVEVVAERESHFHHILRLHELPEFLEESELVETEEEGVVDG